tara:strand:+ start:318 stop:674 length:357 start_codon:yes stop_codon:yes gene_type:complete
MNKSVAIFAGAVFGFSSAVGVGLVLQAQTQATSETVTQATIQQQIYETELFNNWLHSVQPVSPSGMTRYEAQKTCADLQAASWFMDVSAVMQGMLFVSDNPHAAADAAVIKSYCPDLF